MSIQGCARSPHPISTDYEEYTGQYCDKHKLLKQRRYENDIAATFKRGHG